LIKSTARRDWPDAESITILSNVRKAMKPSSRLIIRTFLCRSLPMPSAEINTSADDTVLRDATRDSKSDTDFTLAPEPLLPNWGLARVRTYELDMTMMNLLGSQARTLPEFIELWYVNCLYMPSNVKLKNLAVKNVASSLKSSMKLGKPILWSSVLFEALPSIARTKSPNGRRTI